MSKRMKNRCLVALYCLAVLLAGCFPDNSLQWSDDGSWGLFRAEGRLFVVDGATGELTPVVEGEDGVGLMPGISADGSQIAYVAGVGCSNVAEGLRLFPPATTAMIQHDAKQLAQKVLAGLVLPSALLPGDNKNLEFADSYHRWVLRAMCEDPEVALAEKLGPDVLEECQQCEISYCRLIVAPRVNPRQGRTLVTLPVALFQCRFSPDGRYIAYVMPDKQDEEMGTLLIASVDGETHALEIAKGVALGYGWRPDGRALAYLKGDGDLMLGVIEEKVVADNAGALLTELVTDPATTPAGFHRCPGKSKQLAGTLFQALMKVQYGSNGRLFFSSPTVKIPTSDLDEPTYSLFCYDAVTGTVVDVLPAAVSAAVGDTVNFFSVSPDGTRVLLPMKKNRFAIYTLGEKTPDILEETEGFGDDIPEMLPSWKSNAQISCLVASHSRFLGDGAQRQGDRNEIIVLNVAGDFHSHLSAEWPDDVLP